ncbi:MAG: VWA domain-containing protein [Phycisphaerales bacterium]|nr:VWA domain-containing protein [Phycisphaerales bacterium]
MVMTPLMILGIAVLVGAVVAGAELVHARRIRRIGRLAFGGRGRPAAWVVVVPALRTVAAGAVAWSALVLVTIDPRIAEVEPSRGTSRHLLIALDVSPSMLIEDAGPDREKVSRAVWAGAVATGILDRLDMSTTRVSLVAFYTGTLPVITETFDKDVIANVLDGLPMYTAFEPGATKLQGGVAAAFDVARAWMPDSATLVVISDGDTLDGAAPARMPPSIADTIVIGVGDPYRSSVVGGHASRQDAASLKQLAARLGGYYHEGNSKHLPSSVVEHLTMIQPRLSDRAGMREIALMLLGGGGAVLALLPPALALAGRPWRYARARRVVDRRAATNMEGAT